MTDDSAAPPTPPRPAGPYTPAVRVGGWLICSGQLGILDGALVEGLANQVRQAVGNLELLLASHGATLGNVVKTTVFLTDLGTFGAMNEVYGRHFNAPYPARSTFEVSALPAGASIEIECIAVRG